jgi:hypothetical protein
MRAADGDAAGGERVSGSLIVVGTGYNVGGQVTPETESVLRDAERCLFLVSDTATSAWLRTVNPRAESLHDCYREGEAGSTAASRMVERILDAVRAGHATCAAFYGHPAILVSPGLEALRRARAEGFAASMLPAISCEDALFADLGVDPGVSGRLLYEATDFLLRPRAIDPTAAMVLLQVGAIGLTRFTTGDHPNREGLRLLAEALLRSYPSAHRVALYRLPQLPLFDPAIDWEELAALGDAPLSVVSTLFVPPLPRRAADPEMLARLQAFLPAATEGAP